ASLEWKGRAGLYRKPLRSLRALMQIADGRAGTWSQPDLIAEVQLKHAQTSLRPPAEIQARIGKGDNVRSVGMMFHVKQKNPARADEKSTPDGSGFT
ncbi:MAG: hypothetical protein II779_02305, partial [Clostridia bacterium]|nr:hypothetical protein [Clostridia bacterium]